MDEESTPDDQIYSRGRTSFFDSENNSEFGLAVPAVGVHHWRMAIRSLVFASEVGTCRLRDGRLCSWSVPCSLQLQAHERNGRGGWVALLSGRVSSSRPGMQLVGGECESYAGAGLGKRWLATAASSVADALVRPSASGCSAWRA